MTADLRATGDGEVGQPGSTTAWFLVVAGNGSIACHALTAPAVVIGREPQSDVRIDDRAFSRRHARLALGATPSIQDLGSKNGTIVDGQVHRGGAPVTLGASRGFQVGPYALVLIAGAPAEAPSNSQSSGEGPTIVADPTPAGVSTFVRDVAASGLSVLVLGETGVGKEVLAETLHRLSGRSGPLCRINCAAIAESLLDSELFGHERGAFTGAVATKPGLLESADGGTIFLDEIGEMPPLTQAKLLRAVEAREVLRVGATRPVRFDARFVSATHRDLVEEVRSGRFRADLYFRLVGVALRVPPLRERRAAIVPLALRLLDDIARSSGRAPPSLSLEAAAALEGYAFPGNVRELRAIVERAALRARDGTIAPRHLGLAAGAALSSAGPSPLPIASPSAPPTGGAERDAIVRALEANAGNQTRAAKALGISRTTLVQKIQLFAIPRPRSPRS